MAGKGGVAGDGPRQWGLGWGGGGGGGGTASLKPILHYALVLRFGTVCEQEREKNARKTRETHSVIRPLGKTLTRHQKVGNYICLLHCPISIY